MLHTHLHLHVAHTRRSNGRCLGTFQKGVLFRLSGRLSQGKVCRHCSAFRASTHRPLLCAMSRIYLNSLHMAADKVQNTNAEIVV